MLFDKPEDVQQDLGGGELGPDWALEPLSPIGGLATVNRGSAPGPRFVELTVLPQTSKGREGR